MKVYSRKFVVYGSEIKDIVDNKYIFSELDQLFIKETLGYEEVYCGDHHDIGNIGDYVLFRFDKSEAEFCSAIGKKEFEACFEEVK